VWVYDLAISREEFLDLNQMVHLVTNFVSVRV